MNLVGYELGGAAEFHTYIRFGYLLTLPPIIFLALTLSSYNLEVNDIRPPALPRCKVDTAFQLFLDSVHTNSFEQVFINHELGFRLNRVSRLSAGPWPKIVLEKRCYIPSSERTKKQFLQERDYSQRQTSRERPKSAPHLRLKIEKGGPSDFVKLQLVEKNEKKLKGDPLGT